MRDLTKQQKDLLDLHKHIGRAEQLPNNVWEELVELNDTEVLYQNVNCYLGDNYDSDAPVINWSKNQLNFNFTEEDANA